MAAITTTDCGRLSQQTQAVKAAEAAVDDLGWEQSRRCIVRKLDLYLMPMMIFTYGLQYLDKAVLGFAAVYTLQADNRLVGQDYSWVSSIFYFGYMGLEYPLASLLTLFPVERYLGFMVSAWGLTLAMSNFSNSYAGLLISRFVLGGLESAIAPSFVVIVARWYRREEQPIRQIAWFCGTPLFAIFGALISYGFGNMNHPAIAVWRAMFLIFGFITFVWGIIIFFVFPSDPSVACFLTPEERIAATSDEHTGTKGKWQWYQVREAFKDPKTYLFFALGMCGTIPAGALSGFSSLIIKGLGFSAVDTMLIGIPANVIQLLSLIISGYISTKFRNMRLISMSASCVPSIIGAILLHTLPQTNKWGRVIALWATYTFSVTLALSFAVIGGNVVGTTKKITVTFLLFVGYCAGSISAPQFFKSKEQAEGYPTGIKSMLSCICLLFLLPLLLRALYMYENAKRDKEAANSDVQEVADSFEDKTDFELRNFRYVM
ncbi:hypothetical protein SEUCBS140593_004561 [Sporothrix eucalyptigena]|uniref:Major facilitator superfamily (MFS) profile domain-containing protein n=1 Tax=Sporothrix eucalyptigena TaxID=1812306 RepID=A0ABP0BQM7_9PEZI